MSHSGGPLINSERMHMLLHASSFGGTRIGGIAIGAVEDQNNFGLILY
jgi:hypothetical protein